MKDFELPMKDFELPINANYFLILPATGSTTNIIKAVQNLSLAEYRLFGSKFFIGSSKSFIGSSKYLGNNSTCPQF